MNSTTNNKEMQVKEPTIYLPEFIPFYPETLELGLNYLQGLLYGFIRFFLANNEEGKFYFSNKQLAKLFKVSEVSISNALKKIAEVGLVEMHYQIKANGGKLRTIQLKEKFKSDLKKSLSKTYKKLNDNKKKKKQKKKKTITKSNTTEVEYGNELINYFLSKIKEYLGFVPPTKYGKERNLIYSMIKVLDKYGKNGIKEGRGWLADDVKTNINNFLGAVKNTIRVKKLDLNYLNTLHAWLKLYMAKKGQELMGVRSPWYSRWLLEKQVKETEKKTARVDWNKLGLGEKFQQLTDKLKMK